MTLKVGTSFITFPDLTTQSVAADSGISSQVFTSSGTFTIPATALKVTVVGGGGGGGITAGGGANAYSGGGGAGATSIVYLTGLTVANTIAVTVGAGGTGYGISGGTSSIASGTQTIATVTATGGAGNYGTYQINGGGGGSGTSGTIIFNGQPGRSAYSGYSAIGLGGASIFTNNNSTTSPNYGTGGVGAVGNTTQNNPGGSGVVIFEW
jgi:hypothetical protein